MNFSQEHGEILKAVSRLYAELESVARNQEGRFKYADLGVIIEQTRPAMGKEGLSLVQGMRRDENGQYWLASRLCHTSGQWAETMWPVMFSSENSKGNTYSQLLGGAATYARRQSLKAILGLAEVDDDGETGGRPTWEGHPGGNQQRSNGGSRNHGGGGGGRHNGQHNQGGRGNMIPTPREDNRGGHGGNWGGGQRNGRR